MRQGTVSISILSGKGGVGKSNIALNLGCALNMAGNSVLLADCDMGLANMDVLLGLTPQFHIQDMLLEDLTAEEVIVPVLRDKVRAGTPIMLLPANSGLAEFVDLDAGARSILRDKINPLAQSYDFLFLDIGAGIAPTAMEFGAMTTFRVVVVTPEPTSLTDSYAMMKVLSGRHGIQDFLILVNQVENAEEGALPRSAINSWASPLCVWGKSAWTAPLPKPCVNNALCYRSRLTPRPQRIFELWPPPCSACAPNA